jgi:hypothetical protein
MKLAKLDMEKKQVVENYNRFHKTKQSTVNLNNNGYLAENAKQKFPSSNPPNALRRNEFK